MFLFDEGPTLETLDFAFHIGNTPTFSYFELEKKTTPMQNSIYLKTFSLRPM